LRETARALVQLQTGFLSVCLSQFPNAATKSEERERERVGGIFSQGRSPTTRRVGRRIRKRKNEEEKEGAGTRDP
jgi:hypothetical protein